MYNAKKSIVLYQMFFNFFSDASLPFEEMGIYRDNLSAVVIVDNFLPIIVIAQNNFDLSITDIAFVIYFVIANKLSR